MKKKIVISLIISVLTCTGSFGQFVADPSLDQFEGTWKWGNGQDSVIIILQKQTVSYTQNYSRERLIGWHKYIKNDQLVESSLQYTGSSYNVGYTTQNVKSTILGGTQKPDELRFYFYDLTLHRDTEAWCRLLPNSTTQLNCHITNVREAYKGAYNQFTLPRDFILIKQ